MELVHSTDYFAAIPKVELPGPVILHSVSNEKFHRRMEADFCLLALVLATAAIVATVMLNWSH